MNNDSIGLTSLLFFSLKNKLESPAIDDIILQTNTWIDEKINRNSFSRFIDRELVSAIFGHYALNTQKKLKVLVKPEKIDQTLSQHFEDNHFFHNYTFSVMVALSTYEQIYSFNQELANWISRKFEGETVFNDAKKLVFTALFFDATNRKKELQLLVQHCFSKLSNDSINYFDKIYYAWVAWQYKEFLSKDSLVQNRQLVTSCLENFYRNLSATETERATNELLGQPGFNSKASLIALGVYIDLSSSFVKQTIVVSKDELSQTSALFRVGSLLSVGLLIISGYLLYSGLTNGIIAKIPIDQWNLNPMSLLTISVIDIAFMLAIVLLASAASSLFWDTAIKGYGNNKLIIGNMKKRVKDSIVAIIVGNIIAGIVLGLVLGL